MTERTTNILGWLAFAAIMAAIWLMFGESPKTSDIGRDQPLIADRTITADSVTTLTLFEGDKTLHMNLDGSNWRLMDGSVLDAEKVQRLLDGLFTSQRREPKVGNTLRTAREELGEATPIMLVLHSKDDDQLFSMTTGLYIHAAEGAGLTYVLVTGEEKAWLVTDLPPLSINAADWQ